MATPGACLEKAQRHGDIDPAADPRALAGLLLAVLRGIEALGKAGKSEASLRSIAETALAVLPRPAPSTVAIVHTAAEEIPRN
jgi:TetR/AcrR family transcriptional regulator, transcriptional repressor for nem operon